MESGARAGLHAAGGGGAGGGWMLVEARLQGGAPWGFTVQGGLEHGEPLIISRVEEGGKANKVEQPLRVGDEMIIINDVELSGYRQEAVALIKGSYKSLKLTVRRAFNPGNMEDFVTPTNCLPVLPLSSPLSFQLPPPLLTPFQSPRHSPPSSAVQLITRNGRSEPFSRPHSWHSTKLSEGQQDQETMDTINSAWPHTYPSSVSTADLSGGFDSSGSYLRKSPDQYSSRGSMESLDPPQLHSAAQHQHPLEARGITGCNPAYSCHQLYSARSSNSIDHSHSKRDSAYSSFSTSSSIPDYPASTPCFRTERSYSMETVPQRGGGAEMLQADMRHARTVLDVQQGVSQEQELSCTSPGPLTGTIPRGRAKSGPNAPGSVGGVCYRGSSSGKTSCRNGGGASVSNRHSVGPIWGSTSRHGSCESLKGAPAPPRRSDSYTAIKNHDRPSSWSSLENVRPLRSLQKGSWHHSSSSVASAKGSYGAEGQLHTVIEKSPESSPTTKPRQGGGGFLQLHFSSSGCSSRPASPSQTSACVLLPAGISAAPHPNLHYFPSSAPPGVLPPLARGRSCQHLLGLQGLSRSNEGVTDGWSDEKMSLENGHQSNAPYPPSVTQLREASRPHMKTNGGKPDGTQRPPDHPGASSQSSQGVRSAPGRHQDQNQGTGVPRVLSGTEFRTPPSQEMDILQSWGDPSRSDRTSAGSEPATSSSRLAQGQVPPRGLPALSQPSTSTSGDSAAPQYLDWTHRDQDKDRDNPLTRLEMALAEVQRCTGPDHVNLGAGGSAHSLSVLEKISCFERRERSEKQRSQSTGNPLGKTPHRQMSDRGRGAPCGTEDLRNMLERSTKGIKAHRTMSYRGGELMTPRVPADPSSALQRSRSSFQLDASRTGDTSQDFPWRQEVHKMTDPWQETSSNSRQLSPAKCSPPEKRGPQTMPKPLGIIIPQHPLTSPHTPKERHVISPDVQSPPDLPSVPPVGPPPLTRICGRRRLTTDQKKRSYSEPENMNKVGVSGGETTAVLRSGGETSVADRRRMFELAASHAGGRAPPGMAPRPELRQVQQDALAEYVERKRGVKRGEGEQRSGSRPPGAPEPGSHPDTPSVSSASSLLSLLDSAPDHVLVSPDRSFSSTVPPGGDMSNLQSSWVPPGRVTTQRPPAHPEPSGSPGFTVDPNAQRHQSLPRQHHRDEEPRPASSRRAHKSASAEDLLAPYQDGPSASPHGRPRPSAAAHTPNQSFLPDDVGMVEEAGGGADAAPRSAETCSFIRAGHPSHDFGHALVTRRERQRNADRQRAHSTSALAASVGLPCNFSPLTTAERGTAEWRASERLSQANLDAITFPDIPPPAHGATVAIGNRLSLSDGSEKDGCRRLETRDGRPPGGAGRVSSSLLPQSTPSSPPSSSHSSVHRRLSSLRISESSLVGSVDQRQLLGGVPGTPTEDLDEVFLQNPDGSPSPPPPPPPPPETNETNVPEDFPPPPPPLALQQSTEGRLPVPKPPPSTVPAVAEDDLGVEYRLLPRRERTPEELRVETLARQLVMQDPSLASFLDTWGGKSIVELMEESLSSSRRTGQSDCSRRGGARLEDGVQPGDRVVPDQRRETDVDGEERDLNIRKVELCEALRSSVAALEREKEVLCEEQKDHQALGESLETLVQGRLKANERDKYILFIGDLEKIVNLLLSLCSRLARIDTSLLALGKDEMMMSGDTKEERDSLHHKRSLLLRQTEDARELKEHLDRRQRAVHAILSSYLSEEQLQAYCHFVSTKPSLLTRQRHLDELMRRSGEQLRRLAESLPAEVTEAHGWLKAWRLSGPAPRFSAFPPLGSPSVGPGSAQRVRSAAVTPL